MNPHPFKLRLRAWWRRSRIVRVSSDMQWLYIDEGQPGADFWISIDTQSGILPDALHGEQFDGYFRHTTRFTVNDKTRRPPAFAHKSGGAVRDYETARLRRLMNADTGTLQAALVTSGG